MIDDYEERAAIMHHDGGLPLEWAESVARICTAPKPGAYTDERWQIIVEDACRLMCHLPKIIRNGWSVGDVRALLPHLKGREVTAVGLADVTLMQVAGAVKVFRRPKGDGAVYWTEGKRG